MDGDPLKTMPETELWTWLWADSEDLVEAILKLDTLRRMLQQERDKWVQERRAVERQIAARRKLCV